MTTSGSQAALVQWEEGELTRDYRELLNLSYAGMCLRSTQGVAPGTVQHYLLNLKGLVANEDPVLVKARVQWVQDSKAGGFRYGVSFLESSKGWLS